ncbi:DUF2931 family protein [Pseudaeromonas paramecii]|uniref:DUF2931 family protein n=1 Tax=Pseudaeromonas paramecii TaxID=2138166 RepID=UPI0031EE1A6D
MRKVLVMLCLCLSLLAQASEPVSYMPWRYGVGSNIDDIEATRTVFYRNQREVYSDSGAGIYVGATKKGIMRKSNYWGGRGGFPTKGTPVPDKALLEMVSYHDHKRYRIEVDLPADLGRQMQQVYLVDGRHDRRDFLYFGLAPGGYYEVLLQGGLLGVSPDILLARGIASEVTDDWRDKRIPIARQYKNNLAVFDEKYGALFKQYPIPLGMAWAPIMDAYRAAQPKTDEQPITK